MRTCVGSSPSRCPDAILSDPAVVSHPWSTAVCRVSTGSTRGSRMSNSSGRSVRTQPMSSPRITGPLGWDPLCRARRARCNQPDFHCRTRMKPSTNSAVWFVSSTVQSNVGMPISPTMVTARLHREHSHSTPRPISHPPLQAVGAAGPRQGAPLVQYRTRNGSDPTATQCWHAHSHRAVSHHQPIQHAPYFRRGSPARRFRPPSSLHVASAPHSRCTTLLKTVDDLPSRKFCERVIYRLTSRHGEYLAFRRWWPLLHEWVTDLIPASGSRPLLLPVASA